MMRSKSRPVCISRWLSSFSSRSPIASPPSSELAKSSQLIQGFRNSPLGSRMPATTRSEEHTSELQSLMRISYAVFCLKNKNHPHSYQHKRQRYVNQHRHTTLGARIQTH